MFFFFYRQTQANLKVNALFKNILFRFTAGNRNEISQLLQIILVTTSITPIDLTVRMQREATAGEHTQKLQHLSYFFFYFISR